MFTVESVSLQPLKQGININILYLLTLLVARKLGEVWGGGVEVGRWVRGWGWMRVEHVCGDRGSN